MLKYSLAVALIAFSVQVFATANPVVDRTIDLSKEDASAEFQAVVSPGSLHINGNGAKVSGQLLIKDKSLTGNLLIHLNELTTGISLRDTHMKEKFLEVPKYPDANLSITEMNLPENPFQKSIKLSSVPFKGTLKVHGVDNPINGTADIDSTSGQVVAEVATQTKISSHQIEKPSYLGVKVNDEVEIKAHLKIKN